MHFRPSPIDLVIKPVICTLMTLKSVLLLFGFNSNWSQRIPSTERVCCVCRVHVCLVRVNLKVVKCVAVIIDIINIHDFRPIRFIVILVPFEVQPHRNHNHIACLFSSIVKIAETQRKPRDKLIWRIPQQKKTVSEAKMCAGRFCVAFSSVK